jgi:integrase
MLARPVGALTKEELEGWRDALVDKGLTWNSANRYGKSCKAMLALAARRDKRITNTATWKEGLKPRKIRGNNAPPRDNYYLADQVILAVVRECHVEGDEFGALIEVLAATGTRESQALKLRPGDIRDDDPAAPRLMIWCSNKGRDRDPEQRSVPISAKLAAMLRARAIARGPTRPLFDRMGDVRAVSRRVETPRARRDALTLHVEAQLDHSPDPRRRAAEADQFQPRHKHAGNRADLRPLSLQCV